jgi:hypothetical protein
MSEPPSASASCTILMYPTASPPHAGTDDQVYWSDPPDRVLSRLRSIKGRREWWWER